ncbi:MAG: nucleotidyltransferase family protein [bacterium]
MDFKQVLALIIADFEKAQVRYAVMGGFALGALGIIRSTADLDFLVHQEDLPKIKPVLLNYGYQCRHQSENVSQYISDLAIFGEIDFIHAIRDRAIGMLSRANEISVFDGTIKLKVLIPEDIIGLKLQAIVNDPKREPQDMADIDQLIIQFKDKLNWDLIAEYFTLFNRMALYQELRTKYELP